MIKYTPLSGSRAFRQARLAENINVRMFIRFESWTNDISILFLKPALSSLWNHRHTVTYHTISFLTRNTLLNKELICSPMNSADNFGHKTLV